MKGKVFFIIPYLIKGGAQRVVCNLSNYLSKNNYSITIVVLNDCEVGYHLEKEINVIHLFKERRNNSLFARIFHTVVTFYKILRLCIRESPNYLIGFTTTANMWAGIMGTILRIPFIVSERNVPSRTIGQFNPIVKRFVQYLYKNASAVVSPSEGIQKQLQAFPNLKDLDNYHVIKNPVTEFNSTTNSKVHHKPFILAVGRLQDVKGFDLLIEAYNRIEGKDMDLIIVGDGPARKTLTSLIHKLNLTESVHLAGRKSNMQDYYSQCEMFVLSSRNEGYPNVLIEAMSSGCAAIAFDCETGPSEIINHAVNGMLVENGNIEKLTDAISAITKDRILKETLALNAKSIGFVNSIDKIGLKWEELLLQDKSCSKRLSY
jgi:glycosyltransferase involved in cell wall biosynthesis